MLSRRAGYENAVPVRQAACPEYALLLYAEAGRKQRGQKWKNIAAAGPLCLLAVLYDCVDTFERFGKNLRKGRKLQLVFGVLGHFLVKIHPVFTVNEPGFEGF